MSWAAVAAAGVAVGGSLLSKDSSGGGSSGGGSSGAGQVAQGAANVVGGALSANEAQQFGNQLAQTANPFGQYNQQYGSQLNQLAPSILSTNYSAYQPVQNFAGNTANTNFAQPVQNFANNTLQDPYSLGGRTLDNFSATNSTPVTSAINGQQLGSQLSSMAGNVGADATNYNNQINSLVSNPGSIYNTPQYQAAFGQGQNAVNATLAAQGLNASGNQLAALQSYGQTFGQNAYNTQLSQLSGLYGQALGANQQQYAQVSGAYGQALGANQQQYAQMANNASTNLSENQNAFNQQLSAAQLGMSGNTNAYNQLASSAGLGLNQNNQTFNQLAQLSGLSSGSPTAAAAAMSNVYSNVNSAYQGVGQGLGQLASGVGNLLNGLGTSSTTSGVNQYGFNSGLGDMSNSTTGYGDVAGSGALFGTSAGLGGDGYNYSGTGNTWGF